MQDRFKFRIWDLKHNLMLKPEKERTEQERTIIAKTYIYDEWYGSAELELTDALKYFDNKPFLIMQCSGVKDNNDKLIYEGDILKFPFGNTFKIGVVRYVSTIWDVSNSQRIQGAWCGSALINCNKESEIIGNIYENPELLDQL